MKTLVIDASVAAKWFPPLDQEPLAPQARLLLERWRSGLLELIAPDFIRVEVANVFWKAVRSNRCSPSVAKSALNLFRTQNLSTFAASALMDRTLSIAISHGRTAYDSLYVALAVHSGSELVTADEKLANTLAAHLPVKWLGAI